MHYTPALALPLLLLAALLPSSSSSSLPPLIPSVHSFTPSQGTFHLSPHTRILIDAAHASSHDAPNPPAGDLTLLPPTLSAFAHTFASDLQALFPHVRVDVATVAFPAGQQQQQQSPQNGEIILTLLGPHDPDGNFTLAKGVRTREGYRMEVSGGGVVISGSGARGVFWGTRTLMQGMVLGGGGGGFPAGVVRDWPDWGTRGFMLDVGRQWYPITFLAEICAYASWFKMNEFASHVHLSDNLSGSGPNIYARLRLRSQFPGLTPHVNETYSREEFEAFQQTCAARGVTVIPEIESPGHALVITQWKPELAIVSDPSLLNLTVPETIPTVKSIWQEFLPWIHSKQVSIGADEYDASLADDYNNFVDTMSEFIGQEANKSIRIWGTNEPSNTTSVSKAITIQHWEFFEDDPFALIREGYNVINSDDAFQYIVIKHSGSYPQMLNQTRLWEGANEDSGGIWDPHVFDRGNASNNPRVEEPLLQGAIMAAWNDNGRSASTFLEAFYAIKEGLPAVVAAGWQAASRANHLTHEQFVAGISALQASAPGQNLNRMVASKGAVIVEYKDVNESSGTEVEDRSGNGYLGRVQDGIISTPLGSKGHNYTLLVETTPPSGAGNLLAGPDDTFGFTFFGEGLTLAFNSTNITYPLLNYTLPSAERTWLEIVLVGTEMGTSAFVDGEHAGDFVVGIGSVFAPMAFVAPLQSVGIRGGNIARFTVWDGVFDVAQISSFSPN